jgi:CHAT domain-containing protein
MGWRNLFRRRGQPTATVPADTETLAEAAPAADGAAVAGVQRVDEAQRALDAFLGAGSWEATHEVLVREQRVLLGDAAVERLRQAIEAARAQGDVGRATALQQQLELLFDARARGIEAAWEAFLAAEQARNAVAQALVPVVVGWLNIPLSRAARHYAQAHAELFAPETERIFAALQRQYVGNADALQSLRTHEAILADARARGRAEETTLGTQALDEAFVNAQGGLMLDVPAWLEEVEGQAEAAEPAGQVTLWREALARAEREDALAPEVVAALRQQLWEALYYALGTDAATAQEEGIAALQAALAVYTRERYPLQYAMLRSNLGRSYSDRIAGDHWENVERAIAYFTAALGVYTREATPLPWAITQGSLGNVYRARPQGERADNYELAVACFTAALEACDRDAAPAQWANAQNNLGVALMDRIRGDRAENLERAVGCYQAALEVYTPEGTPEQWAMTQNNLGIAYKNRVRGDAAENLERALACYAAALRVRTREALPADWAVTQNNLGRAYADRIRGDRAENIEQAIACFIAALEVRTREAGPSQWALTTSNLGDAYAQRVRGERRENLRQAIGCYQDALTVFTRAASPADWASTQNALGNAYSEAVGADAAEWIERAIACYDAALEVYTREAFPLNWAHTLANLGNAYRDRLASDPGENVERALTCYDNALDVLTRAALPADWASLQVNLGNAYLQRVNGERAENLEEAIRCYDDALAVYTETAYPEDWARTQLNLGAAYSERIREDRAENLEQALDCTRAAARVYTRQVLPEDWARIQHNLGKILVDRVRGEHAANVEEAIACYNAALQVYTREAYPVPWAMTQISRSNAYKSRIRGGRAENLEEAIRCYAAALEVYTEAAFPLDWALVQNNLGNAYSDRVRGERAANVEQAIDCYKAALRVRTRAALPLEWAATRLNLGAAYIERVRGDRGENVERAIACYEEALEVYTRDALPLQWASAQNNLGSAYVARQRGEPGENLERALLCYQSTLEVYTRETLPADWARMQSNLGNTFFGRIRGDKAENVERAIAYTSAALEVYTREAYPLDWALGQTNLGRAYVARIVGDRGANLDQALACYTAALGVYTRDEAPREWARVQQNLGEAYAEQAGVTTGRSDELLRQAIECYEAALGVQTRDAGAAGYRLTNLLLAEARAGRGEWEAAHTAYTEARSAEELLLALSAGARGQDALLREGRDAGTREAYALARLGRLEEALLAVERGRGRALAEMRALAAADPERIEDTGRRERYRAARQRLLEAQAVLNRPWPLDMAEDERRGAELARIEAFRAARLSFDAVVAEIQEAGDPANFLPGGVTLDVIRRAASDPTGRALVYLLATPWGGLALTASGSTDEAAMHVRMVELPGLTYAFVMDLLQQELDARGGRIVGGFGHAQEGRGFSFVSHLWPGETFAEKTANLHAACVAAGVASALDAAAQEILTYPTIATLAARPLTDAEYRQIDPTLAHAYLQRELRRCLPQLGAVALQPVAEALRAAGASGAVLIPCGALAAFPLTAAPLNKSGDATEWQTFGDALAATTAPSARTLLHETMADADGPRAGVAALGDPRPTHQELRWGEAEALTLAALGGNPTAAALHEDATRERLLAALAGAEMVDACCHGEFDAGDFLRSRLLLARGESLTLGDLLGGTLAGAGTEASATGAVGRQAAAVVHRTPLQGLRLLILSACQTAILDLRGASDEVRSLAAGMVGAGAEAVLGALWSVDDKATYLLIVRFAQEWLPRRQIEPPAAALARAQRWLRGVTNRELRRWEATALPAATSAAALDEAGEGITVRGGATRFSRYSAAEAVERVTAAAEFAADDTRPYAEPIFWSAFQMTGW